MHQQPQNPGPPNMPQGYPPYGQPPYGYPPQPSVSAFARMGLFFGIVVGAMELVAFLLDPDKGPASSSNELAAGLLGAGISLLAMPLAAIGVVIAIIGLGSSLGANKRKGLPFALAGLLLCAGQLAWRLSGLL